jgi:hypothetical protein
VHNGAAKNPESEEQRTRRLRRRKLQRDRTKLVAEKGKLLSRRTDVRTELVGPARTKKLKELGAKIGDLKRKIKTIDKVGPIWDAHFEAERAKLNLEEMRVGMRKANKTIAQMTHRLKVGRKAHGGAGPARAAETRRRTWREGRPTSMRRHQLLLLQISAS